MTDEIIDIENFKKRIEKGFENKLISEENYLSLKIDLLILEELKEILKELKPYWKKQKI